MADINHATDSAYSPEMDGPTHEATYRGFVRFVEIATTVVICWVLSLAVGGVREAWITAIIGVVLGGIGGAIGALPGDRLARPGRGGGAARPHARLLLRRRAVRPPLPLSRARQIARDSIVKDL